MQRDVKIGLSLGLLLVVIVATLFFRREPERAVGPPALADAESLDQAIGERERSPYTLGEPEEFSRPVAPPPSARESARTRPAQSPVIGVLASDDEDLHGRMFTGNRADIPDPIRPDQNSPPPSAHDIEAPAGNGQRTHTIKAGDKLTLLAAKYLGNAARFEEIFAANRGVLKSPNQLPLGVTIVIPPKNGPRPLASSDIVSPQAHEKVEPGTETAAPPPKSDKFDPAAAKPSPDSPKPSLEGKKNLFRPSKRGPFATGRALPRGKFSRDSEAKSESPSLPAPADESPKDPAKESSEPALPRIEVDTGADLLDPDNEPIPAPKSP